MDLISLDLDRIGTGTDLVPIENDGSGSDLDPNLCFWIGSELVAIKLDWSASL